MIAVRGISLEVRAGEIVAIIGSNGAGKTTTLRAIGGLLPVRRGRVDLDGTRISGLPPAAIVAGGVPHVPQGRPLFPPITRRGNPQLAPPPPDGPPRRPKNPARAP